MNIFPTLLKRELWEHRGGMLWTPLVVAGVMTLVAGASMLVGLSVKGWNVEINDERIFPDGSVIAAGTQEQVAEVLAHAIVPSMAPLALVLAFVVLFYALGSLYDERKDRSVLFWKSMPVSDSATVLSKLVSAAWVAPLITAAIGSVVGILVALLAALSISAIGDDVLGKLLTEADFYLAPLAVFAVVPVYALWALPGIAWCMAVSAWARRAPFLWAVGTPVFVGILLSWQEAMFSRNFGGEWFWEQVVGRLFGGLVPGLWFAFDGDWERVDDFRASEDSILLFVSESYATLASPSLWIGLVIGAALIALAIRLRRFREDTA